MIVFLYKPSFPVELLVKIDLEDSVFAVEKRFSVSTRSFMAAKEYFCLFAGDALSSLLALYGRYETKQRCERPY